MLGTPIYMIGAFGSRIALQLLSMVYFPSVLAFSSGLKSPAVQPRLFALLGVSSLLKTCLATAAAKPFEYTEKTANELIPASYVGGDHNQVRAMAGVSTAIVNRILEISELPSLDSGLPFRNYKCFDRSIGDADLVEDAVDWNSEMDSRTYDLARDYSEMMARCSGEGTPFHISNYSVIDKLWEKKLETLRSDLKREKAPLTNEQALRELRITTLLIITIHRVSAHLLSLLTDVEKEQFGHGFQQRILNQGLDYFLTLMIDHEVREGPKRSAEEIIRLTGEYADKMQKNKHGKPVQSFGAQQDIVKSMLLDEAERTRCYTWRISDESRLTLFTTLLGWFGMYQGGYAGRPSEFYYNARESKVTGWKMPKQERINNEIAAIADVATQVRMGMEKSERVSFYENPDFISTFVESLDQVLHTWRQGIALHRIPVPPLEITEA